MCTTILTWEGRMARPEGTVTGRLATTSLLWPPMLIAPRSMSLRALIRSAGPDTEGVSVGDRDGGRMPPAVDGGGELRHHGPAGRHARRLDLHRQVDGNRAVHRERDRDHARADLDAGTVGRQSRVRGRPLCGSAGPVAEA